MAEMERVEDYIQEAISELKAGNTDAAILRLEDALSADPDDAATRDILTCLHWWLEKFESLTGIAEPYDEGFFIMGQWGAYYDFLSTLETNFDHYRVDRGRYAVRHFVYAAALKSFEDALADPTPRHDPGLLLHIGRCYKGVGNYEKALSYLERVARIARHDGAALAELADVYAFLGDEKRAKVLFREAFFIDPDGIDINVLECAMIVDLAQKVKSIGITGKELPLWIPVYGKLFGVFSITKELSLVELGKLNQEIFALQDEVRKNTDDNSAVPRLINRYLRQLDHYETCEDESDKINEILLRIKVIDPQIYNTYISVEKDQTVKAGQKN